ARVSRRAWQPTSSVGGPGLRPRDSGRVQRGILLKPARRRPAGPWPAERHRPRRRVSGLASTEAEHPDVAPAALLVAVVVRPHVQQLGPAGLLLVLVEETGRDRAA